MFNHLKRQKDRSLSVATNSSGPGDYELGSIESLAAARALADRRRKQGRRIALIMDSPRPEWFPLPRLAP